MIRSHKIKIRELEGPKLRKTMKRRTLSQIRSSSTNTIEDDQWKHSNGSSGSHHMNITHKIKNTSTPRKLVQRNKKQRSNLSKFRSSSTNTIEENQWKHSNGSSSSYHMKITHKIKNTSTPRTLI